MIVISGFPPNIDTIKEYLKPPKGTVFCYGDIIFNPDNKEISTALLEHETLHTKQQAEYGITKWWSRYLQDKNFRTSQEVPAYQIQFREYKKIVKDRNKIARIKRELAKTLSSEMYGNCITFEQALEVMDSDKLYEFDVK